MFKGLVKVGLVSMLAVGSLSAASYTAYIGCKVGGQVEQPAYTCIKSIKLNGRLNTTFRTIGIVMGPERMPLGEHFLLEVDGSSESIYTKYVRIVDSNNKEVYYDEDNKRYKFFKIKN